MRFHFFQKYVSVNFVECITEIDLCDYNFPVSVVFDERHPPGMPKPTCLGANLDAITGRTEAHANLEVMRLKVLPTAIGRIPPNFFSRAHNDAPYMISPVRAANLPLLLTVKLNLSNVGVTNRLLRNRNRWGNS